MTCLKRLLSLVTINHNQQGASFVCSYIIYVHMESSVSLFRFSHSPPPFESSLGVQLSHLSVRRRTTISYHSIPLSTVRCACSNRFYEVAGNSRLSQHGGTDPRCSTSNFKNKTLLVGRRSTQLSSQPSGLLEACISLSVLD